MHLAASGSAASRSSPPRQTNCAPKIHNRMPVILEPETWPAWLGEEPADAAELKALLAPYPADEMICWPINPRVGNVKNNDPSLIERVAAVG
jgi:putative SOS response-associated peptidase YedK